MLACYNEPQSIVKVRIKEDGPMIFKDRKDAGKKLAEMLFHYRDKQDTIVLGLPRGGVTVAYEIAKTLNLPLDLLIVRKIGFPGNPELAIGALSETGALTLNEEIIATYGVSRDYLAKESERQKEEIARRKVLYRGGEGLPALAGKSVILVDDGIATGATVKAAIRSLKQEKLGKLILALPVASPEAELTLRRMVDEWICLQAPSGFMAVGSYYYNFTQVEDEEVIAMLNECREREKLP